MTNVKHKTPGIPKKSQEKANTRQQSAGSQAPNQKATSDSKTSQSIPEEFQGKTVAAVFGEIVWLLSRSPKHKDLKLSDLEALVMPPILLRQFKLYYAGKQPVAVEFYAQASPAIAARIDAGDKKLSLADWKSGDLLRIVDRVNLTVPTTTKS